MAILPDAGSEWVGRVWHQCGHWGQSSMGALALLRNPYHQPYIRHILFGGFWGTLIPTLVWLSHSLQYISVLWLSKISKHGGLTPEYHQKFHFLNELLWMTTVHFMGCCVSFDEPKVSIQMKSWQITLYKHGFERWRIICVFQKASVHTAQGRLGLNLPWCLLDGWCCHLTPSTITGVTIHSFFLSPGWDAWV